MYGVDGSFDGWFCGAFVRTNIQFSWNDFCWVRFEMHTDAYVSPYLYIHTKKRLPLHTWIIHSSIHLKTRVTSFAMKFHNSFFQSLFFGLVCLYSHWFYCVATRKQLQYLWLLHLNINIHLAHIDVCFCWSEIVVCSFVRR